MKIIAGISSVHSNDVLSQYISAGVDEFFFGYVPEKWSQVYGWEVSCNRREHSAYHYYTIGQVEDLVKWVHGHKRKAFMTLNAHEYNNKQIKLVLSLIKELSHIPIDAFIVSNLALMLEIRNAGIDTPINVSIGSGSNSFEAIQFYLQHVDNIGRVVLPRKLTIEEIGEIAAQARQKDVKLEAFGLADPCFFNDEYCFTWHGAANKSFCDSPMYMHKKVVPLIFDNDWKSALNKESPEVFYAKRYNQEQKIISLNKKLSKVRPVQPISREEINKLNILRIIQKCGLCALQKFKEFGVESIKLPLRGYSTTNTNLEIIRLVRKVLNEPKATPQFCKSTLRAPNFCSGKNCFYNYPYSN